MKRFPGFALACLTLIGVTLVVVLLFVRGAESRHAVTVSAVVAMAVQLLAYAVSRRALPGNPMAGWGLGIGVRLVAIVLYALVAAPRLGLALSPALLSLVLFFFLTTLIEPLFLKP